MIRRAALLSSLLFVACASTSRNQQVSQPLEWNSDAALAAMDGTPAPAATEVAASTPVAPELESTEVTESYYSLETLDTSLAVAPVADALHSSRFTIKAGYYSTEDDDAGDLDAGYIINASWMRFFSSIFALEFEVGYLDADGEDGGVEIDLWGAPIMVNGRFNVPLWILDVYGGLGIGGIYYDVEASAGNQSNDDDGFVLGGNAFVGATINLAEAVALGLEAKYYKTDELDNIDTTLDAFAVMLTLGWSR